MQALGVIVSSVVVYNLYNLATRKGSLVEKTKQAFANQCEIEAQKKI